ncbi:MAG: ISH3 family transposase, partial [Xenococcaceae cyanobacterium]
MKQKLDEFPIKLALSAQETLAETIACLTSHISLDTKGAFEPKSLFQILLRAASKEDTIEQTAKELKEAPSSNNIRYHLGKINNFNHLEEELNLSLRSQL